MLVWRWIRRHAAVPILVLTLVLLALSWSSVMASKEKGTFELVDLQGDRSAIADVSIGGMLGIKLIIRFSRLTVVRFVRARY